MPTLTEYFERSYLPHVRPRKRSWKKDESLYRPYLRDRFGTCRFNGLKKEEISLFHADLPKQGLSPASADHVIKVARQVGNLAVGFGVIEFNPIARIKLFNADNRQERYMTPEELERLWHVLRTDESRPVCLVALMAVSTGMRLNELLSAKWQDITSIDRRELFGSRPRRQSPNASGLCQ